MTATACFRPWAAELRPGDDLAGMFAHAADVQDDDILVVTNKVEDRLVPVPPGAVREDVRLAAIESEAVRVVASLMSPERQ